MNPHNLNERLIIQQGIFLCPGNITQTFEENIIANFSYDNGGEEIEENLIKVNLEDNIRRYHINCDLKEKKKILQHLHRMNMNNATLFPGLGGFSESLRTLLAFETKEEGGMLFHTPGPIMEYLYEMNSKCNYEVKNNNNEK